MKLLNDNIYLELQEEYNSLSLLEFSKWLLGLYTYYKTLFTNEFKISVYLEDLCFIVKDFKVFSKIYIKRAY